MEGKELCFRVEVFAHRGRERGKGDRGGEGRGIGRNEEGGGICI